MRLTNQGIVNDLPDDADMCFGPVRPASANALLRYWHSTLDGIDEDYTLGDLMSLLAGIDDVAILDHLVGCHVAAFLTEGDQPRRLEEDDDAIDYLTVRNLVEPQRYEPDPSQPDQRIEWMDDDAATEEDRVEGGIADLTGERRPRKIIDATGEDPITGQPALRRLRIPKSHGRWMAPYRLDREFCGWGKWKEPYVGYFAEHPEIDPACYEGAFALEFTPLSDLRHLPLRYDASAVFSSGVVAGAGEPLFETQMTITFGEFLRAIFWEIGFFGTPNNRDETRDVVRERAAAIDRCKHQ